MRANIYPLLPLPDPVGNMHFISFFFLIDFIKLHDVGLKKKFIEVYPKMRIISVCEVPSFSLA